MRTLIILGAAIVLSSTVYVTRGVAGAVQAGPSAAAQAPHDHEHGTTADAPEPQRGMRGGMMAKKKSAGGDALNHLVATMNAATGDAKIAAMADLLSRLVQQQTDAAEAMKAMQSECAAMKESADGKAKHEH